MPPVTIALVFVVAMLALAVVLAIGLSSLSVLGWALWPGRAAAVVRRLEGSFARCALLGALDLLAVVALARILGGAPGGRVVALVLLVCLALALVSAFPAVVALLGRRVLAMVGRPSGPVAESAAGCSLLCGVALLPWAGWACAAMILLAALGSGVVTAVVPHRPIQHPVTPAVPPAPAEAPAV